MLDKRAISRGIMRSIRRNQVPSLDKIPMKHNHHGVFVHNKAFVSPRRFPIELSFCLGAVVVRFQDGHSLTEAIVFKDGEHKVLRVSRGLLGPDAGGAKEPSREDKDAFHFERI